MFFLMNTDDARSKFYNISTILWRLLDTLCLSSVYHFQHKATVIFHLF